MAQEFHISVTPLGAPEEYLVRIERVAPGVPLAEEQVKWPIEDWLAKSQQLMNDPLTGLLQGNQKALATQSSLNLVALGQELYNQLFHDTLRESWMMARAIAFNQGSVLRLRLGLKGTLLPRLPWEVLHAGDRPLATGTDVAFSRYQLLETRNFGSLPICNQTPASEQKQPLKILMVIAGPSDQETLMLSQEARHLQEELSQRRPNGSPTIQLEVLKQPGREQLTQALEQGQYQVFHYAGHSNLGVAGGDLYLVSGTTGLTETLHGDDLAGLLVNNGIQLAVFNSCRGAHTATSDVAKNGAEGNLAQALVKRGIPSVLAMAERIPDDVALTLTRLFYRNLNQGYPIDLSLSRARQGLISAYGSNHLYWALPVLYLHPQFDGFLSGSRDAAELLALPDPSELFIGDSEEEALFAAPPMSMFPNFLDADDELVPPRKQLTRGYADDEMPDIFDDLDLGDSGREDDIALVSDLFRQINEEPTVPGSRSENLLPKASEHQKLPDNPLQQQPKTRIEPALTTPQTEEKHKSGTTRQNLPQRVLAALNPLFFLKGGGQGDKRVPIFLPVLGTSLVAIALLGFWFFNRDPRPSDLLTEQTRLSITQQPTSNLKQVNFKTAPTGTLATAAVSSFNQGNLDAGLVAVEELLNRYALPQAKAALNSTPKQQLDKPAISFLRGRLAWQSIATQSKDFSVDDARRFWEVAVKKEPNNPLYLKALAFAYYAEGNFDRSIKVWFDALSLSEQKQAVGEVDKKDTLDTYAGLALALRKSAQKQPADKREKLLNEAMKLRQKVMTEDSIDFQPEALSKNWMWSEKAIQDWRSLISATSL